MASHSIPVVAVEKDFRHRIEGGDNPVSVYCECRSNRSLKHVPTDGGDHAVIGIDDLVDLFMRVKLKISAEVASGH